MVEDSLAARGARPILRDVANEDTRKVVWVLGAGFSAALGGPMLAQLLSYPSASDIRIRYGKADFPQLHDDAAFFVRGLYQRGTTNDVAQLPNGDTIEGERMWSNAEEFLDYIDTAADARPDEAPNYLAARLNEIMTGQYWSVKQPATPKELRAAARRLIAAECCAFLEGVNPLREQWEPFREWERKLGANDTVITFNYDLVVEMLIEVHDAYPTGFGPKPGSPVKVIRPGQKDDMRDARSTGRCPLLKLHGSVDWRVIGKITPRVEVMSDRPPFALRCAASELAIATPGPSKSEAATSFQDLWIYAHEALTQADVVVFVGYRFPETDAYARAQLLGAIRENHDNRKDRSGLSLHVVLGGHREHTERLGALLRHVCRPTSRNQLRSARVDEHPLFAQDFLSVSDRDDL